MQAEERIGGPSVKNAGFEKTLRVAQSLTRTGALALLAVLAFSRPASAQVVISTGIQEIYDDNIFLEDDKGVPPPFVVDSQLGDPNANVIPPKQVNGHPDEDFLTDLYVGVSGAIPLTPALKTSADVKVGAIIFADNSNQSRMTLDSTLDVLTEKSLLPDPYYVEAKNVVQSRASDITAADGTATRQSQTMITSLQLGVRDVKLGTDTKAALGYTFAYNDFLGDFTFSNSDEEDLGPFANRVKVRGSDYITNGLDGTIDHTLATNLDGGVFAGVTEYTFTNVESNDLQTTQDESDLDRLEAVTGLKSTYQVSQQVSVGGSAGVNYSHLNNRPDDVTVTVIDENGVATEVSRPGQQNDTSFIFGANVNYVPDVTSLLRLAVDQTRSTDVDGNQLITRSVSLDGSKAFGDRWKLAAGGKFLQFNVGSSLSRPTERYEFTLSTQYSLTESIALSAGWNYVDQSTDKDNLSQRLVYASEDYTGNRFFIGLTAGLVGTKS
ncbi:MAG: hypothetical protein U0136_01810 [Bdellovibrionota bacterium]